MSLLLKEFMEQKKIETNCNTMYRSYEQGKHEVL